MSEKVIFITGGNSGIGEAVVRQAVEAGHRVYFTGRSQEKVDKVLAAFPDRTRVYGLVADAASWEDTQKTVAEALEKFGRIDVAIPNAGFGSPGNFATGDAERWRDMTLTNVYGPAILVKATLPSLEKTKGQVILIGSVAGRKAVPGSFYSSTKWAITGMAESLRLQVLPLGIRVTLISPGRVDTPFWNPKPPQYITADDMARGILWAMDQPPYMDVNEIMVRPIGQEI